ncbi:MAG TPA: NUDIX domain-containing protein [Thermoanaerobaculia bacterium]|nr:NUDIX domain-containing protein [Thermoanaerobaculia bacterium]
MSRAAASSRPPSPEKLALSVDCVVFGFDAGDLEVLLVRRREEPFGGRWALPGGLVRRGESLEVAARRELFRETGIDRLYLEQLYTFGDPGREPRRRVVSVAHYALVALADHPVRDDGSVAWFALDRVRRLPFDHGSILATALARLKAKVRYQPIGFELLPRKFTLTRLQNLYEAILGTPLDKRNFRRKILGTGLLLELDERERGVAHRAARLYTFDRGKYRQLARHGLNFEI